MSDLKQVIIVRKRRKAAHAPSEDAVWPLLHFRTQGDLHTGAAGDPAVHRPVPLHVEALFRKPWRPVWTEQVAQMPVHLAWGNEVGRGLGRGGVIVQIFAGMSFSETGERGGRDRCGQRHHGVGAELMGRGVSPVDKQP